MTAAQHHHPQPKLSRNQSEILTCLRRAKEPMSAYAILDRVRNAGISHPPTVYRALNELMQKGMVHRLQSRAAFIACDHGACDGKLAFAICRPCGKVVDSSVGSGQRRPCSISRRIKSCPIRSQSRSRVCETCRA
jgi:Fur family zinc uptake transcriptional regulator